MSNKCHIEVCQQVSILYNYYKIIKVGTFFKCKGLSFQFHPLAPTEFVATTQIIADIIFFSLTLYSISREYQSWKFHALILCHHYIFFSYPQLKFEKPVGQSAKLVEYFIILLPQKCHGLMGRWNSWPCFPQIKGESLLVIILGTTVMGAK